MSDPSRGRIPACSRPGLLDVRWPAAQPRGRDARPDPASDGPAGDRRRREEGAAIVRSRVGREAQGTRLTAPPGPRWPRRTGAVVAACESRAMTTVPAGSPPRRIPPRSPVPVRGRSAASRRRPGWSSIPEAWQTMQQKPDPRFMGLRCGQVDCGVNAPIGKSGVNRKPISPRPPGLRSSIRASFEHFLSSFLARSMPSCT